MRFCNFKKAVLNFFDEEIWEEHKLVNMLTDKFYIIESNFSISYL